MKSAIIEKLNSSEYSIASNCLNDILMNEIIDKDAITILLSIDNTAIISDFLEKYKDFKKNELVLIEGYINKNLDHYDRLFVSDLIEFATSWELTIDYEKCLSFLTKYGKDDDYVMLTSIDYVFENLKFANIDKIYELLHSILHNTECNQSAQVKSAFILFRITHKKEFLTDLMDLVVNGHIDNRLLLSNMLSLNHNKLAYFDSSDILNTLCRNE